MNINLNSYEESVEQTTLQDDIREHHEILGRSGELTLTGEVALVTDSDPEMQGTGAMQVWSLEVEGTWVYVNPDGELLRAACPID